HTATEALDPAFGSYTASAWGTDCAADGTITLLPGDSKTCTITNDDDAAFLKLVKTIVNDNGGTLTISNVTLRIDGTTVANDTATEVAANTVHTASEDAIAGYAASAWGGDCAANGTTTLLPGDDKTCTITNDDIQPLLTVIKVVVNDSGGTANVSSFTLLVDGSPVANGTPTGVSAGTHVVSESGAALANYSATFSGDCGPTGLVTLAVGEAKTCVITNDDIAKVTRTLGFWQTHTAFTTSIFTTKLGGTMTLGNATHNVTLDTTGKLFGGYFASISKTSVGAKRSPLDQARMQLAQQLITAKLNCAAFGCTATIQALVAGADAAYGGTSRTLMLTYASALDAYNNGDDSAPIPVSLGAPGPATPKVSKALANIPFWDAP
ncbi:MAG: hypothetical protein ACT4PT_09990, partial [Methanobacteriota archaeon]